MDEWLVVHFEPVLGRFAVGPTRVWQRPTDLQQLGHGHCDDDGGHVYGSGYVGDYDDVVAKGLALLPGVLMMMEDSSAKGSSTWERGLHGRGWAEQSMIGE